MIYIFYRCIHSKFEINNKTHKFPISNYSLYDERYVKSALFFKTLEGFVEAGPQFALQFSLLLKGRWGESSKSVIDPIIAPITITPLNLYEDETVDHITTTLATNVDGNDVLQPIMEYDTLNNGSLQIFDRIYSEGKTL